MYESRLVDTHRLNKAFSSEFNLGCLDQYTPEIEQSVKRPKVIDNNNNTDDIKYKSCKYR